MSACSWRRIGSNLPSAPAKVFSSAHTDSVRNRLGTGRCADASRTCCSRTSVWTAVDCHSEPFVNDCDI
eukprot:scaffold111490_cov72-Phaeocystis_antarctica.AAC.2